MKKTISMICNGLSLAILLDTIQLVGMFVHFVLIGEIPGTEISISPGGMLVVWIGLVAIVGFGFVPKNRRHLIVRSTLDFRRYLHKRRATEV